LTVEQLAAHVGMSKSALSRIERGLRPYNQDFIEACAEYLRCTPADLLSRHPDAGDPALAIWDRIAEPQRQQALRVLEAFAQPYEAEKLRSKSATTRPRVRKKRGD